MNISSIPSNLTGNATATSALPDRQSLARPASTNEAKPSEQAVAAANSNSPSKQQAIEQAVKNVNDFVKPINNTLSFNLDQDTGQTVIKVVDLSTQEVIRQIPSEEMLAIAKALDTMKGLLVQQKA